MSYRKPTMKRSTETHGITKGTIIPDLNLFRMSTPNLFKHMNDFILKHGYKIWKVSSHKDKSSYIIYEGTLPIALVAHMDTVPEHGGHIPQYVMRIHEWVTNVQPDKALGADDRAGICLIKQIVAEGYKPWIIFLDDEEVGMHGADLCALNSPPPINMMIEIDRRGDKEVVFYGYDTSHKNGKEFEKIFNSRGFDTEWGTCSDISVLAPKWNIAAANISAGFQSEHTSSEIFNICWWNNSLNLIRRILDSNVYNQPWKYHDKYAKYKYKKQQPKWTRSEYGYWFPTYGGYNEPRNTQLTFKDQLKSSYDSYDDFYTDKFGPSIPINSPAINPDPNIITLGPGENMPPMEKRWDGMVVIVQGRYFIWDAYNSCWSMLTSASTTLCDDNIPDELDEYRDMLVSKKARRVHEMTEDEWEEEWLNECGESYSPNGG